MKSPDPPDDDQQKQDSADEAGRPSEGPPQSAVETAQRVAQLLSGLPELAMRAAVLTEKLTEVSPREAAWVLYIVIRRGVEGGPPYNKALLALTEVLSNEALPYDLLASIYESAKETGMGELANALFGARSEDQGETRPVPVDPGGRGLTLGERKWLARKSDRLLLDRLAADADPRVIKNLLTNPRLVEQDVLKIATRRPAKPTVLKEVARSAKWIARYRVKRALVLNPGTPVEISLRLVAFLNLQDLKLVADSGNLPETLTKAAAELRQRN